jgi:hypothetical protein
MHLEMLIPSYTDFASVLVVRAKGDLPPAFTPDRARTLRGLPLDVQPDAHEQRAFALLALPRLARDQRLADGRQR